MDILWHLWTFSVCFMTFYDDMTMLRAFQASREGRSWSHGQCQANPSHVQPHLWPPRPVFLCERSWKTWETHEKKWKKHEKSDKINKSTIEHGCQCPKSCRNVLKCVEMCVCVLTLGKSRSKLAACWRTKLELCLCGFLQGLVFLAEHKPPMHNPRSQDNPNQNDPSTVRQHRNPMETNRNHRNFC